MVPHVSGWGTRAEQQFGAKSFSLMKNKYSIRDEAPINLGGLVFDPDVRKAASCMRLFVPWEELSPMLTVREWKRKVMCAYGRLFGKPFAASILEETAFLSRDMKALPIAFCAEIGGDDWLFGEPGCGTSRYLTQLISKTRAPAGGCRSLSRDN